MRCCGWYCRSFSSRLHRAPMCGLTDDSPDSRSSCFMPVILSTALQEAVSNDTQSISFAANQSKGHGCHCEGNCSTYTQSQPSHVTSNTFQSCQADAGFLHAKHWLDVFVKHDLDILSADGDQESSTKTSMSVVFSVYRTASCVS